MALNKALWTLYAVIFVDVFQLFFVIPLLPSLVASFGGTNNEVSSKIALLTTLAAAAEAIGSPIVGRLSDRFGRRRVMMLATAGGAISAATLGFSQNFFEAAVARTVTGLCGGTMSIANAYVTDIVAEDERPKAQNKITASFSLALAAGPAVGGLLYTWFGTEVACLCAGVISLLNLFAVAAFLKETAPTQRNAREVDLLQGDLEGAVEQCAAPAAASQASSTLPCTLWILCIAGFLFAPIIVVFDAFSNMFLKDKYFDGNERQATQFSSTVATVVGATVFVVTMFLYDVIFNRLGFKKTVIAGGVVGTLGLIGMGLVPRHQEFLVCCVMMAVGFQLVMPAIPTLIGNLSPPEAVGKAFGNMNSCFNWGRVIGPTAFTLPYHWWHPSVFIISAVLFIGTTCVILLVDTVKSEGTAAEAPPQCNVGTLLRQTSIPETIREQLYTNAKKTLTRAVSEESNRDVQDTGTQSNSNPALKRSVSA